MAILINLCTRKKILLRSTHTFGRHPNNVQTLLTFADTSQIHASIRWNKEQWEIIDHSRNGSSIDGCRMASNTWIEIENDNIIQFGQDEESLWQVINLDPPATLLFCDQADSESQIIPLDTSHHLLPDENAPELALYISSTGSWALDQGEHSRTLNDGDIIEIGGQAWEFVCSPVVQATAEIPSIDGGLNLHQITLHFNVSQDEEHVSLKITVGDQVYNLHERVHHYAVLLLARQRKNDAKLKIVGDKQGLLEFATFSKMLGLEPVHVNIHIHRFRLQVFQTIPEASSWPSLIERKNRNVRFGAFKFKETRGSAMHMEL
jgi:pSer/pThr/pTyr-binding forkhead associated (FHA) protein